MAIGSNYGNVGTNFFLMPWGTTTSATEANMSIPMQSGTAKKLMVSLTTAPGATGSATLTIRKNGVDTALSCTVSGTATTCSNTSTSVSFNDGDLVSIHYAETNAAVSRVRVAFEFDAP